MSFFLHKTLKTKQKTPETFQDNPVCRAAVAEALTDQRPLLSLFIFDPRFIDRDLDLEHFFKKNWSLKCSFLFQFKHVGKNDCVFLD